MKPSSAFVLTGIAAGLLGCGDPPPSTPLAPDVPVPDTSKFSQKDIDKFHKADNAPGSGRQAGVPR